MGAQFLWHRGALFWCNKCISEAPLWIKELMVESRGGGEEEDPCVQHPAEHSGQKFEGTCEKKTEEKKILRKKFLLWSGHGVGCSFLLCLFLFTSVSIRLAQTSWRRQTSFRGEGVKVKQLFLQATCLFCEVLSLKWQLFNWRRFSWGKISPSSCWHQGFAEGEANPSVLYLHLPTKHLPDLTPHNIMDLEACRNEWQAAVVAVGRIK